MVKEPARMRSWPGRSHVSGTVHTWARKMRRTGCPLVGPLKGCPRVGHPEGSDLLRHNLAVQLRGAHLVRGYPRKCRGRECYCP
eukprot:56953-Chlamydomonas_euryale.AAC.3